MKWSLLKYVPGIAHLKVFDKMKPLPKWIYNLQDFERENVPDFFESEV